MRKYQILNEDVVLEIRDKIKNELLYIGYDFKYVGTKFLIESILYIYTEKESIIENLEGTVYPQIAKNNNTTVKNVKNNINNATNYMYCECKIEKLKEYFNFECDVKPNTKEVIATIISKI